MRNSSQHLHCQIKHIKNWFGHQRKLILKNKRISSKKFTKDNKKSSPAKKSNLVIKEEIQNSQPMDFKSNFYGRNLIPFENNSSNILLIPLRSQLETKNMVENARASVNNALLYRYYQILQMELVKSQRNLQNLNQKLTQCSIYNQTFYQRSIFNL